MLEGFLLPAPVYLLTVPGLCKPVKSLIGTDTFMLSSAALALCASLEEHQVIAECLKGSDVDHLQDLGGELQPSAVVFCPGDLHPAAAALGRKLTFRNKVYVFFPKKYPTSFGKTLISLHLLSLGESDLSCS